MSVLELSTWIPLLSSQPHWSGIGQKCIIWQFLDTLAVVDGGGGVDAIIWYVSFFDRNATFRPKTHVEWILAFYPVELVQIHHSL